MSDLLKVSLVQSELCWGNVNTNLKYFSELLSGIDCNTDLVILPEMFTSGFLMHDKHKIAPKANMTMNWMCEMADNLDAVIVGSIIVEEKGKFYNRLLAADRNGIVGYYDKRHLFRMGEEHKHFNQGTRRLIFNIENWRICPFVCYDLRFPVWSRNLDNYDLLIYVANWPEPRRDVWNTLLKARAIENQAYTIGVNRIGIDDMNLSYTGDSCAIDAKGNVLDKCNDYISEIRSVELDLAKLRDFRKKFPVHLDADSFEIKK